MNEVIRKHKLKISIIGFFSILTTACVLYQPTVISNIISALSSVNELGEPNIDKHKIFVYGIILVILGITTLISGITSAIISADLAQTIGFELRNSLYSKIQNFSAKDIEKFSASKLVVRLTNDVTQIQNFVVMGAQTVLRVPLIFFGAFFLAVLDFPKLAWTIIIYIIVVALVMALSMKKMGPLFGGMQKDLDNINTTLKENMLGVRVVKSFVREEKEQEKFTEEVEGLNKKIISVGATFSFMVPTFMFTANILTALAIYLTANWAIEDPQLIGSLVSFTVYLMQIMFAVMMMGMLTMTISRASVSKKRLDEVLKYDPSMKFGNEQFSNIESIELENVSFGYEDELVLENISFSIKKGEKIGIVGKTGSGKSTLVQLIIRMYDISSGNLKINDVNIDEYTKSSLTEKIGYVLQKPTLFSGTIKQNLLQGKADATDAQLVEAAKAAQAYEFISKNDDGFEAKVEQMGNNFSGGQKQRLAIARSLVKKPDLLILDDSTSALDARSEKLVKEAINELDSTVIMVAQKITSVIDMDKIIVLDNGKIDGIGTHTELKENSELYNEIYQTQRAKEL